ncbi:hypothetical protein GSI_09701 [Ganoderma sinense ZZ0214-1]|uniref:Uncharacterized protein n=1 Tax=Ganoderma sinense ZZ0214-1 TaxID=1077348 RepID=A0A2G8S340_9APHY|nr:hypothetical protein GSI_09701 [Ganoderma sinense ZZ0214-1]
MPSMCRVSGGAFALNVTVFRFCNADPRNAAPSTRACASPSLVSSRILNTSRAACSVARDSIWQRRNGARGGVRAHALDVVGVHVPRVPSLHRVGEREGLGRALAHVEKLELDDVRRVQSRVSQGEAGIRND